MAVQEVVNPIVDGVNAGFGFWEWRDSQPEGSELKDDRVQDEAYNTVATHLPEEFRDFGTVFLIMRATAFISPHKSSSLHVSRKKAFNDSLTTLSADPSTEYHNLPPDIFASEYLTAAKLHIFELARLVVQHES